ncbi:MAG TPA: GNAT family N-acetyltransferase [Chloroflexaceae bacterium]|nr:GNAT family N-acetyltransferase [Chloroflexaceae bacterium]
MVIATTERLVLRHLAPGDAAALGLVFGDPEVMHFGDGPQAPEWVEGWLRRVVEGDYVERGYGPYGVAERTGGTLVGYCGLFYFPDLGGRPEVELGYRLARAWWGRGYATEAALAVRDHAFDALGLTRLVALIDPANLASARVAEKIGMRRVGEVMLPGYTHPDHLYALHRPPPHP